MLSLIDLAPCRLTQLYGETMNQELKVIFEVDKNERKYLFSLPINAPLGEAYDACHEMLQEIMKQAQASVEKAKSTREQEPASSK